MAKTLTEHITGNILEKDMFLKISNTLINTKYIVKVGLLDTKSNGPYILIKMTAGEDVAIFRDDIEEIRKMYEWILSFLDVHEFK
ncbi:hypothetical protein [Leptotrichia sp. oral taxon 879]|uniref:hypothetical protein n=1 Tax=Leptotrichia sp. oral taxon 879 TaxID=1227267 RepID=UPI0003AD990C|nr:hypothetical protein [Leptotrichia sp. oral taxon 879]ERK47378.1 hypothetical protein HMPREF1552_02449 [Leptotrichia sp. oral taxon 879 str. F0557]